MKYTSKLILLFTIISCMSSKNHNQNEKEITFSILDVENFEWHMKGDYFYNWHIKFDKKKKKYTENFIGEGCGGYVGSYKILNNILILKKDNDDNDCTPKNMLKIRNCKITIDKESAISPISLDCDDDNQYWNDDIKTEPNLVKKIENEQIVSLGLIQGKTTERVKVREKPDLNSIFYKCWEMNGGDVKEYNSLGKNKFLIFIGRTLDRTKIDKFNNYWYYVYVATDWYEGCESRYGWIYGEFIKFN